MTSFEQPPTTEPVSFDPPTQTPQQRRGKGLWILAVAALVVVGAAAVALAADDDSDAATELDAAPAGDESGDRPSDGDQVGDQVEDQVEDRSGDAPDAPGRGGEPGEQPGDDRGGQIVVEDGEGRRVYDLDELEPGQLLECIGISSQPGFPPLDELDEFDLDELGPMFDEFDLDQFELDEFDLDELGPMFDQFDFDNFDFDNFDVEDFDWEQFQDELGPMLDQFEVPSDVSGQSLDDTDLQAIFDELGIDSLEDLDIAKLMEVLEQLHLGPLFGQFGQFGDIRPAPGGARPAIPMPPGDVEDCLPTD